MPAVRKKAKLLTQISLACQRPFNWHKKWARCWNEVQFCSMRCKKDSSKNLP
ncbi:MAG: DUF2256 domain-containing protein [Proteobacteria bacterium]|nr:DUF2256 domain-containing protein [Pseudomonadota bacterium]MDA1351413.1 DUF2256 domain-containing protein [Pseudomonadota bacterium]